jgi:hypothetical protein
MGPLETEERLDRLRDLTSPDLVLIQDLKRGLARAVTLGLVHAALAGRRRLTIGPFAR